MPEGQEVIYYASGKTKASILAQPQMDTIKSKGYDVLVLTDDIDEFMIMVLNEYDGRKIKEEKKSLLDTMKEALGDKVKDVCLSKRLTDSPVCLVSGDGLSFEMERVMNQMPMGNEVKADKILEINPHHEIFKAIESVYEKDLDSVGKYAELLYSQALLIEGMKLDDPIKFSNLMCELMIKSSK